MAAGFVQAPASPSAAPADQVHPTLVFVPVPGAVVFGVCLLLIAACVVWVCLLWSKGKRWEEQ
jgi:hypothetical protein